MVYLLKIVIFHGYVSHNQMLAIKCRVPGPGSAAGWHLSRVGGGGSQTSRWISPVNTGRFNEASKWRNSPKNGLVNIWFPILMLFFCYCKTPLVFFNMGVQNEAFTHQNWRRNLSFRNTQSKHQTLGLDMFSPAKMEEFVSSIGLSDAKKLTDQSLDVDPPRGGRVPVPMTWKTGWFNPFQPADYPTKTRMSPPILPGLVWFCKDNLHKTLF